MLRSAARPSSGFYMCKQPSLQDDADPAHIWCVGKNKLDVPQLGRPLSANRRPAITRVTQPMQHDHGACRKVQGLVETRFELAGSNRTTCEATMAAVRQALQRKTAGALNGCAFHAKQLKQAPRGAALQGNRCCIDRLLVFTQRQVSVLQLLRFAWCQPGGDSA